MPGRSCCGLHHDLERQVSLFESDHDRMQVGFVVQKLLHFFVGTLLEIVDLSDSLLEEFLKA